MANLKNNAIILIASNILLYTASIAWSTVYVRYLSKHDYGSFMQINLVVQTLSLLFLLGLPSSIFYFVPKLKNEQVKSFMFQTLILLGAIALLATGLLFLFKHQISHIINNKIILDFIYIATILIFIQIFSTYIEPFYISTGNTIKLTKINIFFLALQFLVILCFLHLGYGLTGVFIGIISVSIIKFTVVSIDTCKLSGNLFEPKKIVAGMNEQVKFSIPIGLSKIITNINQKIDQFMIASWFRPEEFAIYNRGAFNLPLVSLIVSNISSIILPELVKIHKEGNHNEFRELWHKSIKKSVLLTYPIIAFFFTFSPELFTVLFTKAYIESATIFNIYMIVQVFNITIWGNIHIPYNNTKAFFYSNMIVICINIILNYVLYLYIGFYGPALATVIARILGTCFHIVYSCKKYLIKWEEFLPWKHLAITFAISLLLASMVSIIKVFNIPDIIKLTMAFIFYTSLYIPLMIKINFVTEEDQSLIFNWINPQKIWSKIRHR